MAGKQGQGKAAGPYPSGPDPNFPDRPDHPDFHLLSQIVQAADREAEQPGFDFEAAVSSAIDMQSLLYLAKQRVLRIEMLQGGKFDDHSKAVLIALYAEAFVLGSRFTSERDVQKVREAREEFSNHTVDAGGAHADDCEGEGCR